MRAGLDIGGTKVDGVVLAPDGAVLARERTPTPGGAAALLAAAGDLVGRLAARCAGTGTVGGVGVGVPGLVDPASGTLVDAVNLGIGAGGFALGPLLSRRLDGLPVVVENDVNASALGAAALLGADDLALLSLGTGLAAGLVVDGVLRRGASGAGGEVGHLSVDPAGLPCGCGQRGCLETLASGRALSRRWPGRPGEPPDALWTAAAAGDTAAVAVRDSWADAVAAAVAALVLTLDPRHVVLGGGVSAVGEPLRAAVSAAVQRRAAPSGFLRGLAVHERLTVLPAGQPVAAIGAADLVGAR
nr:ROK family protein [Kineococcus siccus]